MMHSLLYYTAQGLIAAPVSAWVILTISDSPGLALDAVTVLAYGVVIIVAAYLALKIGEKYHEWMKRG